MEHYLSVDCGGTKLLSLLFNEEFRLVGFGRGGAANTNFELMERVLQNMEESIGLCLKGTDVTRISRVHIAGPTLHEKYAECLRKFVTVSEVESLSEGRMGLLAGLFAEDGIVALSGTGSDVFHICAGCKDKYDFLGGWGGLIGDEGSGYSIGRRAISAAIMASDTRGEKTILTDLLLEHYHLHVLWDIVPMIYSTPNYRGVISQACILVAQAAAAGDKVAISIHEDAGMEMARQVIALKRLYHIDTDKPVVIAGGAWKGAPAMFRAFCDGIHGEFPNTPVARPLFEPIMGGVVEEMMRKGPISDIQKKHLVTEFADYLYEGRDGAYHDSRSLSADSGNSWGGPVNANWCDAACVREDCGSD
jgi:N-acetylglucosamine kinase-like BadF-type ATPase